MSYFRTSLCSKHKRGKEGEISPRAQQRVPGCTVVLQRLLSNCLAARQGQRETEGRRAPRPGHARTHRDPLRTCTPSPPCQPGPLEGECGVSFHLRGLEASKSDAHPRHGLGRSHCRWHSVRHLLHSGTDSNLGVKPSLVSPSIKQCSHCSYVTV